MLVAMVDPILLTTSCRRGSFLDEAGDACPLPLPGSAKFEAGGGDAREGGKDGGDGGPETGWLEDIGVFPFKVERRF